MTNITLYHLPGACSRVTLNALEEIGVAFEDKTVNLMKGEQSSKEYLAINPKGKVPALIYDGQVVTENPAILFFLHKQFPDAKLLPWAATDNNCFQGLADLMWCSSGLHIIVRQLMKPSSFTTGDEQEVRNAAYKQMEVFAQSFEKTLDNQPWWYGDGWSIMDVYLFWVCSVAAMGSFKLEPYKNILDFIQRVRARPSFQRALVKEEKAFELLGMPLPPGGRL